MGVNFDPVPLVIFLLAANFLLILYYSISRREPVRDPTRSIGILLVIFAYAFAIAYTITIDEICLLCLPAFLTLALMIWYLALSGRTLYEPRISEDRREIK